MPRASRVCSCIGCPAHEGSCPELVTAGRCSGCKRAAEQRRGTRQQRGYDSRHERTFREQVLTRDPLCTCRDESHGHGPQCLAPSAHADHHPTPLRDLVALGLPPYHPRYGRGLCPSCHSRCTPQHAPGGWYAQQQTR